MLARRRGPQLANALSQRPAPAHGLSMTSAFDEMIETARRLGLTIRHVKLGGAGGGLALVKGQRQLFVDVDADPEDQLERTARALGCIPEAEHLFMRPDVRQLVERYRESRH